MSIETEVAAKLQEQIDKATEFIKKLSPAQRIVLKQMSQGKDNETVARDLKVPLTTIVGRLHGIYADARIPDSISSRKEKREILIGMYRAFEKKYDVDDEGSFEPKTEPASPEARTLDQRHSSEAPALIRHPTPQPLANGLANEMVTAADIRPLPEVLPAATSSEQNVALSVTLQNTGTIVGLATVTLGTLSTQSELQALLREGYLPEIINDFQSLISTKGVTRVILVKRR